MNRKPLLAPVATTLATVGFAAGASVACAQYPSNPVGLGLNLGLYFPSSTRVQKGMGDQVLSYGFGGTGTQRPGNGSFTPDLSLLYGSNAGNKLFIGSFTYGYEYNLEKSNRPLVPYIRPFVGVSYFDFGITEDTGRNDLKRLGYTYGLEVGMVVSKRMRLAARYNVYSSEQSFSFNGFTLVLSYAFL
jgi:hypothetical protein